jgi:hypothetical protein
MSQDESVIDQETKPPVPRWYWALAIVALLWNLLGCSVLWGVAVF